MKRASLATGSLDRDAQSIAAAKKPPQQQHSKTFSVQEEVDDLTFSRDAQLLLKRTGSFSDTLNNEKHTHRGWLRKLATHGKRWNRRYFVAHGHYLSYFLNDEDVGGKNRNLMGSLDLWRVESVTLEDNTISIEFQTADGRRSSSAEEPPPSALGRMVSRVVRGKGRVMQTRILLQAVDSQEASRWVTLLKLTPFSQVDSPSATVAAAAMEEPPTTYQIQLFSIKLSSTKELHFTEVSDTTRFRIGQVTESALLSVQVNTGRGGKVVEQLNVPFFPDASSASGTLQIKTNTPTVAVDMQWEVDTEVSVDELIRIIAREEDPHPLFLQIPLALALFSVTLVIARYVLEFKFVASIVIAAVFSIPAVSLLAEIFPEDDVSMTKQQQPTEAKRYIISKLRAFNPETTELASERVAKEARSRRQSTVTYGQDASLLADELGKLAEFKLVVGKSDMSKKTSFCELSAAMTRDWKPTSTNNDYAQAYDVVMEKYCKQDFRLVRYLRARGMHVGNAEKMLRTSLLWRIAHRADFLLQEFEMPQWILQYGASKLLNENLGVDKSEERIDKFWLRDKQGSLAMFLRLGHFDWKRVYAKLGANSAELFMKMGIWILELASLDADYLHKKTNGATASYVTLVFDLDGFSLSQQMPVKEMLPLLRRFISVVLASYPEQIKRICLVNTPFLFHGAWQAMRTFIPEDLQRKVSIFSGKCDYKKQLAGDFEQDQVPEYLGGKLRGELGDPFCKNRLPPSGPFLTSDRGARWLNEK